MKEQEQTTQKQENNQSQPDKKDTPNKQAVLEKAAQTIAGDNKLMETTLKILLSPITLISGAVLLIFWFYKMNEQKNEIERLKTENKKLSEEKREWEEEHDRIKKKYKKLKGQEETEEEDGTSGGHYLLMQSRLTDSAKKKTYRSAYLD